MTNIVVSAPGKVIIHGEHAVVFGKRALAGSLGLRTQLNLVNTKTNDVVVNMPDIGARLQWTCEAISSSLKLPLCEAKSPVEASAELLSQLKQFANIEETNTNTKQLATVAFLYLFGSIAPIDGVVPSVQIDITSTLPTSAGLGSSAAFSTCLATSLLAYRQLISHHESKNNILENDSSLTNGFTSNSCDAKLTLEDRQLINVWSLMAEKIIHGRPSGIDNSVSTYGGTLCFKAGQIERLDKMPKFRILLINTHVPRSTKALVEAVRQKHDQFPDIIRPVLESIEAITHSCQTAMNKLYADEGNEEVYRTLETLIDINRHHLEVLGVGHSSLDTIYSIASQHGLHAKLTGAGGGGCAFVLLPPYVPAETISKATGAFKNAGYDCFETLLGGPGVQVSTDI